MPRQARIDYPGALHHVIGRGIDGLQAFRQTKDKKEFLTRLKKSNLQIYAWSLMDNHFHLLTQTGKTPLAEFMRSILTGYALYYNKERRRKGHLFQNRYKSTLCEAEAYLFKLISYVHLNPVKAGIVNLGKLAEYPWTGHKELMSRQENGFINRNEVLGMFGETEKQAVEAYKIFLREGLQSDEDLMGGGLTRSLGEANGAIKARGHEKQMHDERILGSGDFVEETLSLIEQEEPRQGIFKDIDGLLACIGCYYKVEKEEILNSRIKTVREARQVLIYLGNIYAGKSLTEMGKLLNVNTSAASQARRKGQRVVKEKALIEKLMGIK